jgi:hypothetical protein
MWNVKTRVITVIIGVTFQNHSEKM